MSIIRGFIGDWGVKAVEFYYAKSLWINGAILLYALLMYFCWQNYRIVYKYILKNLSDQLEPKVKNWSKSEVSRLLKQTQIPWEAALKQLKLPFLAKSGKLIPVVASIKSIEKLFPMDELILSIIAINKKQEV
jgi:hypothetical protein